MATETGRRIVDMVWEDLKPREFVTAGAIDNAITTVLALGGSTNAVVHMVAVARRAGVPLTIDRFDELARRTPLVANMRPAGKFLMEDFFYAGGLRALLARDRAICSSLTRRTVNGRTLGENIAGAEVFNRDVILPRDARAGRAGQPRRAARQPRAERRGDQARGGGAASAPAHGTCRRVRRLQRHGGAHRRSRAAGDEGLGDRAAERRSAGCARHAGVGPAADPEKASRARRARHGAHLRRADERNELRRVRAARRAGIVRRRTARAGARRRPDRARRGRAKARAEGARRRSSRAAAPRGKSRRRATSAASARSISSTSRRRTRAAISTFSRAPRPRRSPKSIDGAHENRSPLPSSSTSSPRSCRAAAATPRRRARSRAVSSIPISSATTRTACCASASISNGCATDG